MTLELEIEVPQSRQVTLPDSVPVGKVIFTVQTPFDPNVPIPRTSEKFQRERVAFYRLLPDLLKTHCGKVVAIHNEQVIASGDERRPVIDEAKGIAGSVDMFVASVLEEQPIERLVGLWELPRAGT